MNSYHLLKTHPIVETPTILPRAALAEVGGWDGIVAHAEG